jgi:hypothetical protein
MSEELVLTNPIVQPEVITDRFKIIVVTMDLAAVPISASLTITLRDNNGISHTHSYIGQEAAVYINYINTADFTVESLAKQILQKLSNDGKLVGTVRDV